MTVIPGRGRRRKKALADSILKDSVLAILAFGERLEDDIYRETYYAGSLTARKVTLSAAFYRRKQLLVAGRTYEYGVPLTAGLITMLEKRGEVVRTFAPDAVNLQSYSPFFRPTFKGWELVTDEEMPEVYTTLFAEEP